MQNNISSIEFCAGAGGQAIGLERAGFRHCALVEIDPNFAKTLTLNRPGWNVFTQDMTTFDGRPFAGTELFAAGLPCPPFSIAGKQLGDKDERNLFPAALRLIDEIRPKAVMIENVRGFLSAVFEDYSNRSATRRVALIAVLRTTRPRFSSRNPVPQLARSRSQDDEGGAR